MKGWEKSLRDTKDEQAEKLDAPAPAVKGKKRKQVGDWHVRTLWFSRYFHEDRMRLRDQRPRMAFRAQTQEAATDYLTRMARKDKWLVATSEAHARELAEAYFRDNPKRFFFQTVVWVEHRV